MKTIPLKFGGSSVDFVHDEGRFVLLQPRTEGTPLSDVEIGELLDEPIGSAQLEEVVNTGEKVLLVVPDATRKAGAGQIVNLLVRRLIANGTMPHEISILIATGIHRPVTEEEKREILTPFIVQRLKVYEHKAVDLMIAAGLPSGKFTDFGTTSGGIRISLNALLSEYDRVITVGGVAFHYFAGFTGGRKMICPGVASAETIAETHRLAFDFELKTRSKGVGPGLLQGNPVHEAFVEAASKRPPDFAVNTIVDEEGRVTQVFCGDWLKSHEAACEKYLEVHGIAVNERRDVVVVSCGGFPSDINMIQAHKALDAAARICKDGGRIVLIAECRDGMGRKDFLEWFSASDSDAMADRLTEDYQVNGQTAWSILRKTESFDVRIVTSLSGTETSAMRMKKCGTLEEALEGVDESALGYILPLGSRILATVE